MEQNVPALFDSLDPALFLVLHQRLEGSDTRATSLPYEEDVFLKACDLLLQHRSVATMLGGGTKVSTAAFASTSVAWGDEDPAKEGDEGDPAENGDGEEGCSIGMSHLDCIRSGPISKICEGGGQYVDSDSVSLQV